MTVFNSEDFWPQRPWVGRTSTLGRCPQHFEISDAFGILEEEKLDIHFQFISMELTLFLLVKTKISRCLPKKKKHYAIVSFSSLPLALYRTVNTNILF